MAWLVGIFSTVQGWLWAGGMMILAILIGVFIWRGYEVDNLGKQLQAAKNQAKAATEQAQVINSVRQQELSNQTKANQRADQINQTPEKDNGPVAPVLAATLNRL